MIRPGALCVPCSVWQLLQSPFVCDEIISRTFVPLTTFAVYGVGIFKKPSPSSL
jgi:hypothetical protein